MVGIELQIIHCFPVSVVYLLPLQTQHVLAIAASELQSHWKSPTGETLLYKERSLGAFKHTSLQQVIDLMALEETYNGLSLPNKLAHMQNLNQCHQASQAVLSEEGKTQHQWPSHEIRQKASRMLPEFLHSRTGSGEKRPSIKVTVFITILSPFKTSSKFH